MGRELSTHLTELNVRLDVRLGMRLDVRLGVRLGVRRAVPYSSKRTCVLACSSY